MSQGSYAPGSTRAPTVNPTSTPMMNKMIAMITDTEVDKPE